MSTDETIEITLTRDSVSAGDDMDAPHRRLVRVAVTGDPVALAQALARGYLPRVTGTGHRWICLLNEQEIAVLSADGSATASVAEIHDAATNRAHFRYHAARR